MQSFLTGANLVWIIGIISSIIAGLNALRKYRYEKKLEQFKDTNVDLFKQDDKQKVLAAISTLGIFKRDPEFKQHTTNVLLSRLYTELDYDITNAICSTLIQYSNRNELLDISSEVLDINRNFYVQTTPLQQRITDLNKTWNDLNNISTEGDITPPTPDNDPKQDTIAKANPAASPSLLPIEKFLSEDLIKGYCKESLSYIPKSKYELLWHKQITADTYSRILRRAYYSKPGDNSYLWQRYFRLIKAKKKDEDHNELDVNFYQNDFNYVYMADFHTSSCSIVNSAIGSASLVDVDFNNIKRISYTSFIGTEFYNCHFKGTVAGDEPGLEGKPKNRSVIEENSNFTSCSFIKGGFEDIDINSIDFSYSLFNNFSFGSSNYNTKAYRLCFNNPVFNNNKFTFCPFKNCSIKGGSIGRSIIDNCLFEHVIFENVSFKDVYFRSNQFMRVQFINCSGLSPWHFYNDNNIDSHTKLPDGVSVNDINALSKEAVAQYITQSELDEQDKEILKKAIS